MAFVLLEDLGRPLPKRSRAVFSSIRIIHPVFTIARYTYKGSRFLIRKAIWVLLGDRAVRQPYAEAVDSAPTNATQTK